MLVGPIPAYGVVRVMDGPLKAAAVGGIRNVSSHVGIVMRGVSSQPVITIVLVTFGIMMVSTHVLIADGYVSTKPPLVLLLVAAMLPAALVVDVA